MSALLGVEELQVAVGPRLAQSLLAGAEAGRRHQPASDLPQLSRALRQVGAQVLGEALGGEGQELLLLDLLE